MAKVMINRAYVVIALCVAGVLSGVSFADSHYEYPVHNPLAATVVGTPKQLSADASIAPGKCKQRKLKVFEDRVTPKYLWYSDKLAYGLCKQKQKAPLIFIVAGTGGGHTGPKINTLSAAFYNAGFHVVTLPSPTYMGFIVAASKNMSPGLLDDDSHDLYNVMKQIWNTQLKDKIDVSEFHLTGYSLGGAQAAYLAYVDESEKAFNFSKTLVINTPVSLIESVENLDGYYAKNFKSGAEFNVFWKNMWKTLTQYYVDSPEGEIHLTPEAILNLYREHKLTDSEFESLIAVAFRISAASMMVTADVMSQAGYIVPKGTTAKISADVSDYFVVAHRTSFEEYAHQMLLPAVQQRAPGTTFDELTLRASLYPIESYLRNSQKIALVHNNDDIILREGDIAWLQGVFEGRSKIYPLGGHLGNLAYSENIEYIVNYFTN